MQTNVEPSLTTSQVEDELLSYLQQHPGSADTAEGIRQWWLIKRIAERSRDIVQASLDQLVATQILKVESSHTGEVLYRLNKQ